MRQLIPSSSIINDLLAENWKLRWQVLEIFYQTQLLLRDFARSSPEYKQAQSLCKEMAGRLNGASDVNLHLVLTAAWFLGGSHFLLLALEKIGVDDPETGDLETRSLKKPLINNHPEISFFDYFDSLLRRNKAVDAAAATAVRIFPAEQCLTLLRAVPEREARLSGLSLLKSRYPKLFFNDFLLVDDLLLIKEKPELLDFVGPSLSPKQEKAISELVANLLTNNNFATEYAIKAVGRLKLERCRPQLRKMLDNNPFAASALARLGDEEGCRRIIKFGKSWRRKKRATALAELVGCKSPEALELLQNRAQQGNLEERREALKALGEIRSPETLQIISNILNKTKKKDELNLLLQTLSGVRWPGESQNVANQLVRWSDQIDLYPNLLNALATLDYGDQWNAILEKIKSPIIQPHYREIALFMGRFAERPKIRRTLLTLTDDIDWPFSYRLINILAPHLKSTDIPFLLNLLANREEGRALTIKERLTKGQDLERMADALAEFFEQHPEIANLTLEKLLTAVIIGSQPPSETLFTALKGQPAELIRLLLGSDLDNINTALAERDLPILMVAHLLSEIEVDGSDCFAIVVHRTRRYSGFFRQSITAAITLILDRKNEINDSAHLPILNKIIDFIRGKPHYDELRQKTLRRITHIIRNSRELKVYNEASQTRELKIFKVKKL